MNQLQRKFCTPRLLNKWYLMILSKNASLTPLIRWWIWGKPFTKFRLDRFSKLWKFKCPKRKCHNHDSLFTIAFKHLKSPIWISTGNMRFFDKKVLRIKLPFFYQKLRIYFQLCASHNPSWPAILYSTDYFSYQVHRKHHRCTCDHHSSMW